MRGGLKDSNVIIFDSPKRLLLSSSVGFTAHAKQHATNKKDHKEEDKYLP